MSPARGEGGEWPDRARPLGHCHCLRSPPYGSITPDPLQNGGRGGESAAPRCHSVAPVLSPGTALAPCLLRTCSHPELLSPPACFVLALTRNCSRPLPASYLPAPYLLSPGAALAPCLLRACTHLEARPPARSRRRLRSSSSNGYIKAGGFAGSVAARNPHSVVHGSSGSRNATPNGQRGPVAPGARNPLGGVARPPRASSAGVHRAASTAGGAPARPASGLPFRHEHNGSAERQPGSSGRSGSSGRHSGRQRDAA